MKSSTEVSGITLLGNQQEISIRYGENVKKGLSSFLKEPVSKLSRKVSDSCFLA